MPHDHHHDHSTIELNHISIAFAVGIVLNLLLVIVQVIAGLYSHSLSLLSDAGHNFSDVGSLVISLIAFKLLSVKSNKQYTYGYKKTSVLSALFNSIILLLSIGAILYEAIQRLMHPMPVPGLVVAGISGLGIVINAVSAYLFMRDKEKDINIKSAYLHLLSDAVISLALLVGGIIIYFTNWFWVDSILSIVVAIIILVTTWKLLIQSLRLSLDGVPLHIDVDQIKKVALTIHGITDIHHVHVWAISTTENALTAHVVLKDDTTADEEADIKHELKHQLFHNKIHHVTLETEREHIPCETEPC